jgi:hypothetical protein
MSRNSILWVLGIWLSAWMLGSIVFGSAILPPAYHEYIIQGQVERQNGGSRENFVLTLAAKFHFLPQDSIIELTDGRILYPSNISISVTDTGGHFYLDLKTGDKADSIAIKVAAVDRPAYLSPFMVVPQPSRTLMGETQSQTSGCKGCENITPAESYVAGYEYQFPDQIIVLP